MLWLVFGRQRREKCSLQEPNIQTKLEAQSKWFRLTTEGTFCPVTEGTSASQLYVLKKALLHILSIITDNLKRTVSTSWVDTVLFSQLGGYHLPMGDLRLSGGFLDEHIRDLKTRLQRLQLVNLHPRHVSLETVELKQQPHLRDQDKGVGMS